ncbi:MAG: hypothetical protein FWD17_03020 [Polyangiaceae bacterium]|nr:hypothetical protein [Polyangiaceae bacterium]
MGIADKEAVEISVLTGTANPTTLVLFAGSSKNPFSVGSAGEWRVAAEGVAPVHLYLAFDGRELFAVPAAPELPVLLAGAAIGGQWTRIPLPCELRFAGACLVVRTVVRDAPEGPAGATMRDGGALRKAAERAVAAAQRASAPGDPNAPTGARAPERVTMPPELFGTIVLPDRPVRPGEQEPAPRAASGPKPRPSEADPTIVVPPPNPVPQPARLDEARAPRPNESAEPPAPAAAKTGPQEKKAYGQSGGAPAGPSAWQVWQDASPLKKALIVIAPITLGVAAWTLLESPAPPPQQGPSAAAQKPAAIAPEAKAFPPAEGTPAAALLRGESPRTNNPSGLAQRTAVAGAAADAARAGSAPSGSAASAVAPSGSASPAPAKKTPSTQPPGTRTPERQALDAVAAGSFDDAAKQYGDLASAHADIPAYQEAARILREKASRAR